MHVVIRQSYSGIVVIGPFDKKKEADHYLKRRVSVLKEDQEAGRISAGSLCYYVTEINKPMATLLDPPEVKTCGCCEHGS